MNRSIKISIVQFVVLLVLASCAFIIANFYLSYTDAVTELGKKIVKESSGRVIERTENLLLSTVAFNHLTSGTAQAVIEDRQIASRHEDVWKAFWEITRMDIPLESVYIGTSHGEFIQTRRYPKMATRVIIKSGSSRSETIIERDENYRPLNQTRTIPPNQDYDPRERAWYRNTGREKRNYWTGPYVFSSTKMLGITGSLPLLDRSGAIIAVAAVDIPLEFLSDFIRDQKITENSRAFIVNEKYELIAYPEKSKVVKKSVDGNLTLATVHDVEEGWLPQAHVQSQHRQRFLATVDGKTLIVNVINLPERIGLDWRIIITTPYDDLYSGVLRSLLTSVLIAILIVIVSIAVAYHFSSRITKPIARLADMTGEIKDFNLDNFRGVRSGIKEVTQLSISLMTTVNGLKAFRKYVPADLVRELIRVGQDAKLGGEAAEVSMFFSDIEGFTSISERMNPEELMVHISEYLDELSRVIMQERGTIDKYIGDSIMAFWGAPSRMESPEIHACRAALACQARLRDLNKRWSDAGKPVLKTRIGLNSGMVIVGNLGSTERLNYTIIGDEVNLASRLEGINKEYGTYIIAAENLYEKTRGHFFYRFLDIVAVKGKVQGVKIYELMGHHDQVAEERKRYAGRFESALDHFFQKDFGAAESILMELQQDDRSDASVNLYLERIASIKKDPGAISANSAGCTVMTHK